jgi:hypothetical protein
MKASSVYISQRGENMMLTSFYLPKLLQHQLAERMLQRLWSGGCGGFDGAAATTSAMRT